VNKTPGVANFGIFRMGFEGFKGRRNKNQYIHLEHDMYPYFIAQLDSQDTDAGLAFDTGSVMRRCELT